ncbi:hypothetical protein NECAME_17490 [Necator americanus]|uniref:WH2 domain-containing protein n=1 Tax=Necator americanus TaxID=51031 RepID=W2TQF3_NECAM|nr:hypothetical protein NECAME_17490 [Necator americanus]ETN83346.1 hypothetical protein NECAME_17490 [Necator americanus]
MELSLDDYLNPNWDAAPSFETQSKLTVASNSGDSRSETTKAPFSGHASWVTTEELAPPPLPSRLESMTYRSPVGRRKTPPMLPAYRSPPPSERPPRLSDNRKSDATVPSWRIEIPLPNGTQAPTHSPPPTPPSSQSSPVPSHHATATAQPTALLTSTGPTLIPQPPNVPPPPPPGLLSPAPTPPPSEVKQRESEVSPNANERKTFLEEIQNVDKAKLRHVDIDSNSRNLPNGETSPGDGGLLSAIQAELDKRREYIMTDSDADSDSTDSDWTD